MILQIRLPRTALTASALGAILLITLIDQMTPVALSQEPFEPDCTVSLSNSIAPVNLDQEDKLALEMFGKLTRASENSNAKLNPLWNSWKTKCNASLKNDVCSHVGRSHRDRLDFFSMDLSNQITSAFDKLPQIGDSRKAFVDAYVKAPQLSSVLFNSQAARSIKSHHLGSRAELQKLIDQHNRVGNLGSERHLPDGSFKSGSTVVKLIWEILPANATSNLWVYDADTVRPAQGDLQLPYLTAWLSSYTIDFDASKQCPDRLPDYGTSVPVSCLYAYHIHGDKKAISELSKNGGNVVLGKSLLSNSADIYAVLVGVHVMTLTADHPQWQWSTFYWTRESNHQTGWRNPWRHFQMMSTDKIREEAFPSHKFAFNPYLEGRAKCGIHANCLSCHSLAAYDSKHNDQKITASTLASIEPLSPAVRQSLENSYFQDSLQTGFMWSIATNQPPVVDGKQNAFLAALQAYFLNHVK